MAKDISIHALREEGDMGLASSSALGVSNFYPRPPRGGRHLAGFLADFTAKFLSTPSARRATAYSSLFPGRIPISIHALREEGDKQAIHIMMQILEFLSTPSARRATC